MLWNLIGIGVSGKLYEIICHHQVDVRIRTVWVFYLVLHEFVSAVKRWTENEAQNEKSDCTVSKDEIPKFFALLYMKAMHRLGKMTLKISWSKAVVTNWAAALKEKRMTELQALGQCSNSLIMCGTKSMSWCGDKVLKIMKYWRFDIRSQKSRKLRTDKFSLTFSIWDINKEFYRPTRKCYLWWKKVVPYKVQVQVSSIYGWKTRRIWVKFWLLPDVIIKKISFLAIMYNIIHNTSEIQLFSRTLHFNTIKVNKY